jgi:Flp pilus assembly protein TadB
MWCLFPWCCLSISKQHQRNKHHITDRQNNTRETNITLQIDKTTPEKQTLHYQIEKTTPSICNVMFVSLVLFCLSVMWCMFPWCCLSICNVMFLSLVLFCLSVMWCLFLWFTDRQNNTRETNITLQIDKTTPEKQTSHYR